MAGPGEAIRVGLVGLLLVGLASPAAAATGGTQQSPALVRDVQTSIDGVTPADSCALGDPSPPPDCSQPDTQVEPSIAVNPENPLNVVTAFQEGRRTTGGDGDNGWATTFDGGATWIHGEVPGLTVPVGGKYQRASDAAVAFGPNNTVYINSLGLIFGASTFETAVTVNVSSDGGRTWGQPVVIIDSTQEFLDKNWITVDNGTGTGHHPGRVYAAWDADPSAGIPVDLSMGSPATDFGPVFVAYSDDQGATWQTGPSGLGYVVDQGPGIGALPLVMPNGDLAVIYDAYDSHTPGLYQSPTDLQKEPTPLAGRFQIAVASNAGTLVTGAPLAFGPALTLGSENSNPVRQQRAGEGLQAAAVDPTSGKLYVVWEDGRFRSDAVDDIVMSTSSDGRQWSYPARVNPGATSDYLDHWCPMIAVGADGTVHVAYRQRQEAATVAADGSTFSRQVDTMYLESHDGGTTWSAPLKVNRLPNDMYFGAASHTGVFLGDYDQLAVGGDQTYIAREEPFSLSNPDAVTLPPIYHHQRNWVAVVGPAAVASPSPIPSASPSPSPSPTTVPTPSPSPSPKQSTLPLTTAGRLAPGAGLLLVLLLAGLLGVSRRLARS